MPGSTHKPHLKQIIDRVRLYVNEPAANAKYDDECLYDIISMMSSETMTQLMMGAENPIVVRFDVTLDRDTEWYALPPYVNEIVRIAKFGTGQTVPDWTVEPRSRWNPGGPAIEFMGQSMFRVSGWMADQADTISVEFVPSGELMPYYGQISYGAMDVSTDGANTVVLNTNPTGGIYDRRPNAYLGMIFRVYWGNADQLDGSYSVFPISDHVITAWSNETNKATVQPDFPDYWSTLPSGHLMDCEIVPVFGKDYLDLVVLKTAIFILALEAPQRVRDLNMQYQRNKRGLLSRWQNFQSITGRNFIKDTDSNDYYGNDTSLIL